MELKKSTLIWKVVLSTIGICVGPSPLMLFVGRSSLTKLSGIAGGRPRVMLKVLVDVCKTGNKWCIIDGAVKALPV